MLNANFICEMRILGPAPVEMVAARSALAGNDVDFPPAENNGI
jgi:hypothetical protein